MVSTRFLGVAFIGLAAAASLSPDCWGQNVWVVDDTPGPGVSFPTIQGAIDAAADRDIILVKGGAYTSFTINGKGLVILGDVNADITFPFNSAEAFGPVATITNTAPWQAVVLRGLGEGVSSPISFFAVSASNCAGPIWIEDCAIRGVDSIISPRVGIAVSSCASVAIAHSTVQGGNGFSTSLVAAPGVSALSASGSTVQAFDSTFHGGWGASVSNQGLSGGSGAVLTATSLYAVRSTFQGGAGGAGIGLGSFPAIGGNGGGGLVGNGSAVSLNCQFIAGPGGPGANGGSPGLTGPLISLSGPFTPLSGPNFSHFAESPIREQQTIRFHLSCEVPADVYLFLAPDPGLAMEVPGIYGPLLVDLAALGYVGFGVLPAGATTISIPLGDLPPTMSGAVLSTQAIFIDPNFAFIEIGEPSHLVLLDGSF